MKLISFLLLIITKTMVYSQSEYFKPYPIDATREVEVDTMGTHDEGIIDSTGHFQLYRKNLETWLVENKEKQQRAWRINRSGNILNLRYHNFNGGEPELILTWQSLSAHSGWQGGVSEQSEQVVIYDLEHSMILMHLDTYILVETWWQDVNEDSLNTDSLIISDSGSDIYCEEYLFTVSDSSITYLPLDDGRCQGVQREEEKESEILELVWRKDAFYRKD